MRNYFIRFKYETVRDKAFNFPWEREKSEVFELIEFKSIQELKKQIEEQKDKWFLSHNDFYQLTRITDVLIITPL